MTRHYAVQSGLEDGIDWDVWGGELVMVQYEDRLVVERADRRIAMGRELWLHLHSVSYHPDKQVAGGPLVEAGLLSVGVADDGVGRVTYRSVGTADHYVLLEMVFA